jgi:AraC-like DNA-binding protein
MLHGDETPRIRRRRLFEDRQLVIGEFVWDARRIGERRRNVTGRGRLLVIPWSPVRITHDGGQPIIADPQTVVFYGPYQPYEAEQLVQRPERSFYFNLPDELLDEWTDKRPLPMSHGPCDSAAFLAQRRLMMYLMRSRRDEIDPLRVHEEILILARHLLSAACSARGIVQRGAAQPAMRRRRDCAMAAQQVLLRRYRESLSLPQIAQAVGISPFHLCRAFRAFVGQSLHQYRTELRLRAALEPLCESDLPLAHLALELGFSSQSHFTTAFQSRFGITPAALRRKPASTFLKDRQRVAP